MDFQAYRELDSNYMEILKIALDDPDLRDPKITTAYPNITEDKKLLKYETMLY